MEENNQHMKLSRFLDEEKVFLDDLKNVNTEKNWERFLKSAGYGPAEPRNNRSGQRYRIIVRIAAAILLLIAVTTTVYFTYSGPAHRITRASAGPHQMELTLSDGSSITLNEGAVLIYPEKLNRRSREVSLDGEAYFQVERAERSLFYVHISNMTVKVVGTSFNLKENEKGCIELGVVEGAVLFYEKDKRDEAIRLTAGERCLFDPTTGRYQTDTIPSNNYLYWKTRRLTYKDESLDSVFQELEIIFKKEIIVSDSLILQNRWNSTHEGQSLNEIVGLICEYFELEYTEDEDTISIQRKQE